MSGEIDVDELIRKRREKSIGLRYDPKLGDTVSFPLPPGEAVRFEEGVSRLPSSPKVAAPRLDLREVILHDAKTGDGAVSIGDETVQAIRRWLAVRRPRDPNKKSLFLSNVGRRPSNGFLPKALKTAKARAGIPKEQRVFGQLVRASRITHLLNLETNPKIVMHHARHSDIRTTMIYARPSMGDERKALDVARQRIKAITGKKEPEFGDLRRDLASEILSGKITPQMLMAALEQALPHKDKTEVGGYS